MKTYEVLFSRTESFYAIEKIQANNIDEARTIAKNLMDEGICYDYCKESDFVGEEILSIDECEA